MRIRRALSVLLTLAMIIGCFSVPVYALDVGTPDSASGKAFTFNDIKGTTCSTVGKDATALVFGRTTCPNTKATLTNLAASEWIKNKDVSIVYVDVSGATKDEVTTFASEFKTDRINFTYGNPTYESTTQDPDNPDAAPVTETLEAMPTTLMNLYMTELSAAKPIYNLPVIIYLDKSGVAKSQTTGLVTVERILAEVTAVAGKALTVENAEDPENPAEYFDELVDIKVEAGLNNDIAKEAFDKINTIRTEAGLTALKWNTLLVQPATQRAAEAALYYDHTRPNGESGRTVSELSANESLAVAYSTAEAVVKFWDGSTSDKANIVNENYKSAAVACFNTPDNTQGFYWAIIFSSADSADTTIPTGKENKTFTINSLASSLNLGAMINAPTGENKTTNMNMININKKLGVLYLSAAMVDLSQDNFEYSSLSEDIATVDEQGSVTFTTCGKATLVAKLKNSVSAEMKTSTELKHNYVAGSPVPATCISEGYTPYECSICGNVDKRDIKVPAHVFEENAKCEVCGEVREFSPETDRIFGNDRYETSVEAAERLRELFKDSEYVDADGRFKTIIVACGNEYADALAGSYLAKVANAPILLTPTNPASPRSSIALDYIKGHLSADGKVYILGGTGAVPQNFEDSLSEFLPDTATIKRLSGENRYLTNLEILKEAGAEPEEIVAVNGGDYADALSVSATGKAILLINPKKTDLYDEQKAYLGSFGENHNTEIFIAGGTGAVSTAMMNKLKPYDSTNSVERVYGDNRYLTSIEVAKRFFGTSIDSVVIAYGMDFADGLVGGPLAYALSAPLILTSDAMAEETQKYVKTTNILNEYVMGGTALISDESADKIISLK